MIQWLSILILSVATLPNLGFEETLNQSKAENKPTMLVFSGSDWCRGCISFKRNVLDTEAFETYSKTDLTYFVADFPRDKSIVSKEQLAENESLADQYNRKGLFPYLVLFNADGKVIRKRGGGFDDINELKAWVEQ